MEAPEGEEEKQIAEMMKDLEELAHKTGIIMYWKSMSRRSSELKKIATVVGLLQNKVMDRITKGEDDKGTIELMDMITTAIGYIYLLGCVDGLPPKTDLEASNVREEW